MPPFRPDDTIPPRVLVTDLDGTLIPLENIPSNHASLARIRQGVEARSFDLVFATGRHFGSVLQAIEAVPLPRPSWIACDVGTSIYRRESGHFQPYRPYQDHLHELTRGHDREAVMEAVQHLEGLDPQPEAHQGTFKISFYCPAPELEKRTRDISVHCETAGFPYRCLGSLDPFTGMGLIDLLPTGVNKAYAILWLSTHSDFRPDEVVFSGDSENDLAALVSGFRAILVGNALPDLAEQVRRQMEVKGYGDRLYLAREEATCGVLEGIRHFGLLPAESREAGGQPPV